MMSLSGSSTVVYIASSEQLSNISPGHIERGVERPMGESLNDMHSKSLGSKAAHSVVIAQRYLGCGP
jgi:hypothetical protein